MARFRKDAEIFEKHSCKITIDWEDELRIEGYEDTMCLKKDEALEAAHAIISFFQKDQPK